MAQKMFYLNAIEYKNRLRDALVGLGEGELITNPDLPKDNRTEFFYFSRWKTSMLYGGKNTLTIVGYNEVSIRRTKSKLEKISGVKLTEVKG